MEDVRIPQERRGDHRRVNPPDGRLSDRRKTAKPAGRVTEAKQRRQARQRRPAYLPTEPNYRRLGYVRDADDSLLGFAGPPVEAAASKQAMGAFLRETMKRALAEAKTRISHGRTEPAHCLGYALEVMHSNTQQTRGPRSSKGKVGLKVPRGVIVGKCQKDTNHEQPIHRAAWLHDAVCSSIAADDAEDRGIVASDRLADNLHAFGRLRWLMEQSLAKTLAHKLRSSVSQVYRRYRALDQGRQVRPVTVEREGKTPLVARWNGTSLVHGAGARMDDTPTPGWNWRTAIVERLLAQQWELCGWQDSIEVHHIRARKDLQQHGRAEKPVWVQMLAARQRQKLIVCYACQVDLQHGRPRRRANQSHVTGAPCASTWCAVSRAEELPLQVAGVQGNGLRGEQLYLSPKGGGDKRLLLKRGLREDGYRWAPQRLSDMAKAALPEPQWPAAERHARR